MILRECPFCGNEVRFEAKSYGYSKDYYEHYMVIRCDHCDFEFPRNGFKVSGKWNEIAHEYITDTSEFDKAIEKWNKRIHEAVRNYIAKEGEQHDR